jgi:putative two-component system response regulator
MKQKITSFLLLADAVIITDGNYNIIEVNTKYEGITGYERESIVGLSAGFLKSGLTPAKTFSDMKKVLVKKLPWSGILINRKRDKELWTSFITITPILFDDEMYYIGVLRDLNDISDGVYVSEARQTKIRNDILKVLALSCEISDPSIEEHLIRVQDQTASLIRAHNDKYDLGLSEEYIQNVINGSIMHDVGKSGIPEGILYKPGPLTFYERNIIETHPLIGVDILNKIIHELEDDFFRQDLIVAKNIVEYHHERWDGSGYPHHLKGNEIPFEAQVVSVVDVYDALISRRAYKEAWSHKKAIDFFVDQKGIAFNTDLVDTFINEQNRLTLGKFN